MHDCNYSHSINVTRTAYKAERPHLSLRSQQAFQMRDEISSRNKERKSNCLQFTYKQTYGFLQNFYLHKKVILDI